MCIRREGVGENEGEASNHWKKIRVDRMLVEHFLRSGFYNSAIRLSEAAKIEDLTNISLFLVAKEVEEALARKDTSKCLAWCHDNKSKMRKMKSTLEFNVRLQEYIELVKAGNKLEAVRHARKHLCGPGEEPASHLHVHTRSVAWLSPRHRCARNWCGHPGALALVALRRGATQLGSGHPRSRPAFG